MDIHKRDRITTMLYRGIPGVAHKLSPKNFGVGSSGYFVGNW